MSEQGVSCSYVVVVTGFECPASVPHRTEFEGGFVCSSEPIDPGNLPIAICNEFGGKCNLVKDIDGGPSFDGGATLDGGGVACSTTSDCNEGEYCAGDCSGPGVCTEIPSEATCTEAEVMYCLCDGTPATHHNGCVWERHTRDRSCWENNSCDQTEDCPEGQYCLGQCGGAGFCVGLPDPSQQACGEALTDYCACDGERRTSPTTCVWDRYTPGDNSCL